MGLFGVNIGVLKIHFLRKKSILLFLVIGLAVLILCLQYNTAVRSEGDLRKSNDDDSFDQKFADVIEMEDMMQKNRLESVQFLMAGAATSSDRGPAHVESDGGRSSSKQFLPKPLGRLLEQPSREEISRRRNSLEMYTAAKAPAEAATTSGLAFKFGVEGQENMKDFSYDGMTNALGIPNFNLESYVPKKRLVHFDLKGAPPKVSYIKKVMALSKKLGATGVLMEYEDMFPYWGTLSPITAGNAYTTAEIKEIQEYAKAQDLEVIPLVQTFGHVEFALKLKNFSDLREVPESPQALCPSNNASLVFVETLIDQVMSLHPSVKYLHIGCDEVFQMGECPKCRSQPRFNIFLTHVTRVASYVRRKYSNVTPIIWDDMLRHLHPSHLEEYRIGELVEPMVWVYAEDIYRFVPTMIWEKYADIFPNVWAASAFKGAFGETMYVPNVRRHLENNLRWLEVMTTESRRFKNGFVGIAITGWQRYDHFAVLCELLPAGIPSLAVNLLAASHGYFNQSLLPKLSTSLACQPDSQYDQGIFNFQMDPFMWNKFSRCFFSGSTFYKLLYRYHMTEKEVKDFLEVTTRSKGWMTSYNVRHNFSSPLRVDELVTDLPHIQASLTSLVRYFKEAMQEFFDNYTVNEWIEQKLQPYLDRVSRVEADAASLRAVRYWPRRPLASKLPGAPGAPQTTPSRNQST